MARKSEKWDGELGNSIDYSDNTPLKLEDFDIKIEALKTHFGIFVDDEIMALKIIIIQLANMNKIPAFVSKKIDLIKEHEYEQYIFWKSIIKIKKQYKLNQGKSVEHYTNLNLVLDNTDGNDCICNKSENDRLKYFPFDKTEFFVWRKYHTKDVDTLYKCYNRAKIKNILIISEVNNTPLPDEFNITRHRYGKKVREFENEYKNGHL